MIGSLCLLILVLLCSAGTAVEAQKISPPLFPEDVVPEQYIVRLRRHPNCRLSYHLDRIGLPLIDRVTKVDLTEFSQIYIITLNDTSRENLLLSDEDCVVNVWHDVLLHTVRDEPPVGYLRPTEFTKRTESRAYAGDEVFSNGATEVTFNKSTKSKLLRPRQLEYLYDRTIQRGAPWHLLMMATEKRERISRAKLARFHYPYIADAGKGVDIYHFGYLDMAANNKAEFNGRVSTFRSYQTQYEDSILNSNNLLIQKRAMIEASLAAGAKNGVAKSASLLGIKVKTASGLLRALSEIITQHRYKLRDFEETGRSLKSQIGMFDLAYPGPADRQERKEFLESLNQRERKRKRKQKLYSGSVISLNLTPWEPGLIFEVERAIKKADDEGILVVVPAGDRDRNTGYLTSTLTRERAISEEENTRRMRSMSLDYPCKFARALCVGAVDIEYTKGHFSSYGEAVHMWAPGVDVDVDVLSTGSNELKLAKLGSGTNLASALVAGWAAVILFYRRHYEDDVKLRRTTYSLRKAIVGNCKPDYLEKVNPYTRNLLVNTGINTDGQDRTKTPFATRTARVHVTEELAEELRQQINDPLARNELHSRANVTCLLPDSMDTVHWTSAQKLYLRLDWERGHSNSYDADDHSGFRLEGVLDDNYTIPIPCIDDSCVFMTHGGQGYGHEYRMRAAETDYRIYDASVLANSMLAVMLQCRVPHEQAIRSSQPTTGGHIVVYDYSKEKQGSESRLKLYLREKIPGYRDGGDRVTFDPAYRKMRFSNRRYFRRVGNAWHDRGHQNLPIVNGD